MTNVVRLPAAQTHIVTAPLAETPFRGISLRDLRTMMEEFEPRPSLPPSWPALWLPLLPTAFGLGMVAGVALWRLGQ
jgi:hypothetical protein